MLPWSHSPPQATTTGSPIFIERAGELIVAGGGFAVDDPDSGGGAAAAAHCLEAGGADGIIAEVGRSGGAGIVA